MRNLSILDATLRDGGCVNDFNFGTDYMQRILESLEESGVNYIELGYIDNEKGSTTGRTKYSNDVIIQKEILKNKKPNIKYLAMIDYGRFDIDKLKERSAESIDGIRMAFHKKDWKNMIPLGKTIIKKGYEFYVQPMITMRYTDKELLELIETVNKELIEASGFYIVDSFGEMRSKDVIRLMYLVDRNLAPQISLGFHSHNNLQLSYSNAMSFIEFITQRNIMLDSSIMGMGKGAGNLNTELLMEHLNLYYDKSYNIKPLLDLIDKVINVLYYQYHWGYAVQYYLSAINGCSPTYASYFFNKQMLPIDRVANLLKQIPEHKKISFDRVFAEELYLNDNSQVLIDDTDRLADLQKEIKNKNVLIIAPGKSIIAAKDRINSIIQDPNTISISLNMSYFSTNYILITRHELLENLNNINANIIALSNIPLKFRDKVILLNYSSWISVDEKTHDESGVVIFNILDKCNPKKILLAGFDGYSLNINDNYYDDNMRKPVVEQKINEEKTFFHNFLKKMSKKFSIEFLTSSNYQ